MRNIFFSLVLLGLSFFSCTSTKLDKQELTLICDTPAQIWEATLPLGNGRIGMMPDGGVNSEKVVLNDITMWSGSVDAEALNPEAINYLPKIRQLLLDGENLEAQKLMYQHFRCNGQGSAFGQGKDAPYGCFQMLGDLNINYSYPAEDKEDDFSRLLHLNDAVASTSFRKGGVKYTREYFVSHTDDVMLIRLTADKKSSISFDVALSRPERAEVYVKDNTMYMKGQLNDGYNTDKGVSYLTKVQLINKGGTQSSKDNSLSI